MSIVYNFRRVRSPNFGLFFFAAEFAFKHIIAV